METYKVLQTGNFYFPIDDINNEFEVFGIYSFRIDDKETIKRFKALRFLENRKSTWIELDLNRYSDIIWDVCKKEFKDYLNKGYYLVPLRISYQKYKRKENLEINVDLLKKVRWYNKWLRKLRLLRN